MKFLGLAAYIERARANIESGDAMRLRYAALDLRLAIESVAYQKLQLRLDRVSSEEISAWQPDRVMRVLEETADPNISRTFEVRVASQGSDPNGEPSEFHKLGTVVGVSPSDIRKHWQKIGSYLHQRKPTKKGERTDLGLDIAKLRKYLGEVIEFLRNIDDSTLDAVMSKIQSFECFGCEQKIYRNFDTLKPGMMLDCQNPECRVSYEVDADEDGLRFTRYQVHPRCDECENNFAVDGRLVAPSSRHPRAEHNVKCTHCKSNVRLHWELVQPVLKDGEEEP